MAAEEKDTTHKTVQIPLELVEQIDKLVKIRHKGYRSRAEFVTDSIRRRLESIKDLDGVPE